MKFSQTIGYTILCLLTFRSVSLAVVGGQLLKPGQIKNFGAFISIGNGRIVSGGVHIGEGFILTAEHVLHPIYENTPIQLRDLQGNTIGSFRMKHKLHSLIPKKVRDDGVVQIPDLAVLVPSNEVRILVAQLPVATIEPWPEIFLKTDKLLLLGVGNTDFDPNANANLNLPRIGEFLWNPKSKKNSPHTLVMPYDPSKSLASGASGDSGSPLWLKRGSKYKVVGIASEIDPPNKQSKNGQTIFARLDSEDVIKWLASVKTKMASQKCLASFPKVANNPDPN